jgi:alkylation response protein AidB-like acyl-CoA dehydrogenase
MASGSVLRERPEAQLAVAEAEFRLRAARAFTLEAVEAVWSAVQAGRQATLRERADLRLASAHCCREATAVVDLLHRHAGTTSIFPDSPLERAARDVRVVPLHTWVAPSAFTAAGRVLLGLDPGTPLL